jgi:hypothetical protein
VIAAEISTKSLVTANLPPIITAAEAGSQLPQLSRLPPRTAAQQRPSGRSLRLIPSSHHVTALRVADRDRASTETSSTPKTNRSPPRLTQVKAQLKPVARAVMAPGMSDHGALNGGSIELGHHRECSERVLRGLDAIARI